MFRTPGNPGLWGPATATLDWCEMNYQFSYYIAEMANSLSNIVTVAFALFGARSILKQDLPLMYFVGFIGVALVGVGSFVFHATMLYEAQMADELPMIYVSSYNLVALFDTAQGFDPSTNGALTLFLGCLLFNVLFSWSYAIYRNPIYHQFVFATLMLSIGGRTLYLLKYTPRAAEIPVSVRLQVARLFGAGALTFVFGFFIWNVDNLFCQPITDLKQAVGWPLAFLFEGHAWWHAFTAGGSYLMQIGNTYLSLCYKDSYKNYSIEYFFGLPYVHRVSAASPASKRAE